MNVLEKIVEQKKREIAALDLRKFGIHKKMVTERKRWVPFGSALRVKKGVALIAEVKKASPSAGVIEPNFDPISIARAYENAGATALSVLTDEVFFQGHLEHLQRIRDVVKLPLLRKDFIIDEKQIYESIAFGADAILLIVAILTKQQLMRFIRVCRKYKIATVVEVHDETELDRALAANAEIIGINNRNLRDFSVSLETTERLAATIISKVGLASMSRPLIVAESGIHTRADVERVAKAGANAILVGESLMRSGNIAGKIKELLR